MGYALSVLYRVFCKNEIWIVLERGDDAQDNAWHFFKYMRNNHPQKHVYYAIKKKSPDYHNNLNGYEDHVIEYDSLKYYIWLYNAKTIISSHYGTIFPSLWVKGKLVDTIFFPTAKFVFLQHGITHNDHTGFHYPTFRPSLIVAGAKREFDLMTKYFNQPNGVINYTGFARFDNLYDNIEKKQILIMPTWRKQYKYLPDDMFIKTDYFQAYSSILTNERLLGTLRGLGYSIIFYNHFEFQKYNHLFEQCSCDVVSVLKFGEKRVQALLKESALLVTDYSSIYYDFTYMQKPVVFFLLNKELFRSQQYGVDFDNPEDFGQVSETADGIIDILLNSIRNDCKMSDQFVNMMNKTFPLRDKENCKRIYEAIIQKNIG